MMFRLRNESDDRLVRDTLAGEPQAFSRLVERYLQTAHAVAFAQTGNHADAEDAAQDAFLKAYQSLDTLRDRNRFGAWLAALTRNAAIDLVRKRQRQDKLAEQLPRKEPQMRTEPERRDEQELVRAHLMAMEEGPREVILLHYFAGHSLREVAQILDISRAAAQKRLVRARDVLSERLVRALGETPSGVRPREARVKSVMGVIAAAPVAWQASAAAGSAGLAGTAASVMALVTPKTLALSALVLLAGGFGIWKALTSETGLPLPQTVLAENDAVIEAETGEPIFDQLLGIGATESGNTEPGDSPAVSSPQIQGHVIDETGKLMPGVKVLPRPVTTKADGTEKLGKGEVESVVNAEGVFALSGLMPGAYDVQLLVPPSNVYTSKSFKRFILTEGEAIDDMQIVYDRTQGDRIFGRVLDLEGNPVADAQVSSKGGPLIEARTNADGEFSFTRFEEGIFNLHANHPQQGSAFLAQCEANPDGFEIVLGGQGSIEGQIVAAETGEPLQDFSIAHAMGWQEEFSWGMDYTLQRMHDDAGRFALQNLQAGNVTIIVRAPGRATTFHTGETIAPGETISGTVIALERGMSVEGRVLDDSGAPVADAMVFEGPLPRVYGKDYATLARAHSDADGRFALDDLSPKCAWVSAFHQDHQPGGEVPVDMTADPRTPVTITLGVGGVVQGRVLLGNEPVNNAEVSFLYEESGRMKIVATRTDGDGNYKLENAPVGKGQIRANIPLGAGIMNERMRFLPIVVEPGLALVADIVFPANECTVEGLVTYNGVVPQNIGVGVNCMDASGVREVIMVPVQPDGSYVMENVPAGTVSYALHWETEPNMRTQWPTTVEHTITSGQTLRQDFALEGPDGDIEQGFWDAVVAEWPREETR